MDKVNLESECLEDLERRLFDQEQLFNELLRLHLEEGQLIMRNHFETRQTRLNNIKTAQFIQPTKESMTEKVSL